MKKRTVLAVCLAVIALNGTGCAQTLQKINADQKEATSEKKELTQEQKKFLEAISMDEDRVKKGDLYQWQEEALDQYDYVMEYLKEKYPSYSFEVISCDHNNQTTGYSTFQFTESGKESVYEMYLYSEGEDKRSYRCEDNFYGSLIRKDYEEALTEIICKEIPECLGVYCSFTNVMGKEFGEDFTAEDVLTEKPEITNATDIYLLEADPVQAEQLIQRTETVLTENRIYGSYFITAISSEPEAWESTEELKEYVQEQGNLVITGNDAYGQFE